ncbi:MAG TPA: YfhO family protein [Bryobacteraceae bacterium]|nr:YfhO family protein [Bryobacteraceae bacterium]
MKRLPIVAAVSLVFTYLFFLEYLSPIGKVHIPYDLEGYHYPLVDYAFQALKEGRFPQWDAAIYSGQTFVGNIQAALFYQPTWLLFAANWNHGHVSYRSLEILVFAHVWLAFMLCYVWLLRGLGLSPLASALGAGVFAFSGYLLLQLQHLGQVAGYAWFPLGTWGIDQAIAARNWRKLWKLAAASALIFLAGYPPLWLVFAISVGTYILFRNWKWTPAVVIALLFSIALVAVQFLPAWEARALKDPEQKYGGGINELIYFISYIIPNYFNFGMDIPAMTNFTKEYLYLGAPGIAGILLALRRKAWPQALPFAAVLGVSLIALTNPYDLVWNLLKHSVLLSDLCRGWNFLAGITFAAAPLAALGVSEFLRDPAWRSPPWLGWGAIVLLSGVAVWELRQWLVHWPGAGFPYGWAGALQPAIILVVFMIGLIAMRSAESRTRSGLVAALLLGVAVDYKIFGTSKRFNAVDGAGSLKITRNSFPAMEPASYREIQSHREYRVLLDVTGPFPPAMRHAGLLTPNGFDPFFSRQYHQLLSDAHFRSNWDFDIAPDQTDLLQLLGVRYVITSESGPLYSRLVASPAFRQKGVLDYFYQVFEYRDAHPPYGFVENAGSVELLSFSPERRDFRVESTKGGTVYLAEQLFPGWSVTVDGRPAKLERWRGAFQAVAVPADSHVVRFEYSSPGLRLGIWISVLSLAVLLGYMWTDVRAEKTRAVQTPT